MNEKVKAFNHYRSKMNDRILQVDNKVMKRLYNLDTNTYLEGALPVKTKECWGWWQAWYYGAMTASNTMLNAARQKGLRKKNCSKYFQLQILSEEQ